MTYNNPTRQDDSLDEIIERDDAPATSDIPEPPGGGLVDPAHTAGENSEAEVGDPGHWGIDEGTE